jgi:hypothetical protein
MLGLEGDARACLAAYREALVADADWLGGGGSPHVNVAVAWVTHHDEPLPDALLRGPEAPWRDAARLVAAGGAAEAADVLAEIGARSVEAEVRLHAAERLAAADPAGAARQLDRAATFWREVHATALLTQVDAVRAALRAAAS